MQRMVGCNTNIFKLVFDMIKLVMIHNAFDRPDIREILIVGFCLFQMGFMNDGRILAADVQYYTNAGNTVDDSVLVGKRHFACFLENGNVTKSAFSKCNLFFSQVAEKILLHMDNAYNIPNLRGRCAACRTNLPSNTAFRGFGVPQSLLVVENMLNDVAMVLGRPADQVIF